MQEKVIISVIIVSITIFASAVYYTNNSGFNACVKFAGKFWDESFDRKTSNMAITRGNLAIEKCAGLND